MLQWQETKFQEIHCKCLLFTDVLFISLFVRKEITVGNCTCSPLSKIFEELLWPEAVFLMRVYKDKVTFCLVYDFSVQRAVTPVTLPHKRKTNQTSGSDTMWFFVRNMVRQVPWNMAFYDNWYNSWPCISSDWGLSRFWTRCLRDHLFLAENVKHLYSENQFPLYCL